MSQPIGEDIVDNTLTQLRAISSDSGDSFTPQIVQRVDGHRTVQARLPCIVVTKLVERKIRDGDAGAWRVSVDLDVNVYLDADEEDPMAMDKKSALAAEDVEKACIRVDDGSIPATLVSLDPSAFSLVDNEELEEGCRVTVGWEYSTPFDDLRVGIS